MKIYLHALTTEAHRTLGKGYQLAETLHKVGVEVTLRLDSSVDWALCAVTDLWSEFKMMCDREIQYRSANKLESLKIAHYCWDLYPAIVKGWKDHTSAKQEMWAEYTHELRSATTILVPSNGVKERVRELVGGRDSKIVLSSCDPWFTKINLAATGTIVQHGAVVNVVRPYPWDPNNEILKRACLELEIPYIDTQGELPWEEFKQVIKDATVLCCPYYEASTGGLTLLEGYALGKSVLVASSKYNGAHDYFGNRAIYFEHDNYEDLKYQLRCLYATSTAATYDYKKVYKDHYKWVRENYSYAAFSQRLVDALRS